MARPPIPAPEVRPRNAAGRTAPAFAGFNGERATTRACHDNTASLRVTRSLPYTEDGATQEMRRDVEDTMLSFLMTRTRWEILRRNDIEVGELGPVREFLGL